MRSILPPRNSWALLSLAAALVLTWQGSARAGHPSDPVAGREHWAFRPLNPEKPGTPAAWARSPIDTFVAAGHGEANLQPVPDAPRRDLLRRLTFQLTGLPPSPEQTRAFLADRRPDTLERVVDGLLNSPRFGERWGRHWLDLARYADSNGLDENFLFREAWRYRNWVIAALNGDLPYDRFLLEQIAGDLLPHTSVEQRDRQRIAAGFLVMGPKVLLGNDAANQRMEVADEQIDTIGRALLGLTLGCARCHDHKFEPVPTADYYALAGILTSTEVMERRHMLGQQRVMERLVGLGPDGDALQSAYESYWRDLPGKKATLTHAKKALQLLTEEDLSGWEALVAAQGTAVAEGARDNTAEALPQRIEAQRAHIAELEQMIARPPAIPSRAMIPRDIAEPRDEAIRIAGQFDRKGAAVPRGYLQVVSSPDTPGIPPDRSGREELGHWLTDCEHGAGVLAARVLANRVWHHTIGRGLVRTVDNFGRTGEPPSHAALLDYLAQKLIASGWSIKALVREIVLSRTFGLSSALDAGAHAHDPDNRMLWRAHRRRLDPESLRDAMLSAAGELDLSWTESTVAYLGDQATAVGKNENRRRTDFPCRSVYLPVIRNDLPELFSVFDFADPHATTGARPQTTAATQGLFLLNDSMVLDAAEATARRLDRLHRQEDPGVRLDHLFAWILNQSPPAAEREAFLAFLQATENELRAEGAAEPRNRAWSSTCHALFSLSRFQFLD